MEINCRCRQMNLGSNMAFCPLGESPDINRKWMEVAKPEPRSISVKEFRSFLDDYLDNATQREREIGGWGTCFLVLPAHSNSCLLWNSLHHLVNSRVTSETARMMNLVITDEPDWTGGLSSLPLSEQNTLQSADTARGNTNTGLVGRFPGWGFKAQVK